MRKRTQAPKKVAEPIYKVKDIAPIFGLDPSSYEFRAFLIRSGLTADQDTTESEFNKLYLQRYKKKAF